jgi:hypothetical protein
VKKIIFIILLSILVLNASSEEKIEIGVFCFPHGPADYLEKVFQEYESLKINRVYYHINVKEMALDKDLFLIASRHKIELIPILNTYACAGVHLKEKKELPPEKWAQIYQPSGEIWHSPWKYDYPSILSPEVREIMRKEVETVVEQGKKLGLKTIALDDEFGLGLGWQGKGWTDFNQHCINYFKEKTGLPPPEIKYEEPGIIDESSPLYRWISIIGYPAFSESVLLKKIHNEDLKNTARKVSPEIKVVQMPGAYTGELDAVVVELYNYMYYAPELSAAWQMDYIRHSQESPAKPVWPLIGWYQKAPLPEWICENISLTAKIALAWGAKSVDFAAIPSLDKKTFPFFQREDLKNAYIRLINEVRQIQPLLLNLHPKPKPAAVLFSNTTEAYQKILDWDEVKDMWEKEKKWRETPWEHTQSFDIAYPSLLLAHIPVEVITEKDILKGSLENFECLFLVNCQYLPRSVYNRITLFQKSGKTVFADKSSFVKPEGTINIPVDFSIWSRMIEAGLRARCWSPERSDNHFFQWGLVREFAEVLRATKTLDVEELKDIVISSDYIVYTLSTDGENDYLFLFNTDLINTHTAEVKLQEKISSIKNVLSNKPVLIQKQENGTTFQVVINKADWAILKIED